MLIFPWGLELHLLHPRSKQDGSANWILAPRLTPYYESRQLPQVYALLGDAELLAKYQQALLESFVDDNDRAKWCPR